MLRTTASFAASVLLTAIIFASNTSVLPNQLPDLIVIHHLPVTCTTDSDCERRAFELGCAIYSGEQLDDHASPDELFICHAPTYRRMTR